MIDLRNTPCSQLSSILTISNVNFRDETSLSNARVFTSKLFKIAARGLVKSATIPTFKNGLHLFAFKNRYKSQKFLEDYINLCLEKHNM